MPASTAPNDTRLPRAVRMHSSRLDERYGSKGKSPNPADPSGPAETPPTGAANPSASTPPVDLPPAEPASPTIADLQKQVSELEQKNRSLGGRLNAQAEERRTERAGFQQKLTELQEQIRNLQTKQPPAEIDLSAHFTAEEIEVLGKTQCTAMIATARRIAQENIDAAVEAAVKPLREKQAATEQSAADSDDERYFAELLALVPDWDAINKSDGWLEWLEQVDEGTGIQLQKILNNHHTLRNAKQVAKVFKRYLKEAAPAPSVPTPVPPVAARSNGAQPNGDPPPNAQVPGRLAPPTPKEIQEFHRRSAVKRPGQQGYVTDMERVEFEARMKLLYQR